MTAKLLRILAQIGLFGVSLFGYAIAFFFSERFGWDTILTWNSVGMAGLIALTLSGALSLISFGAVYETIRHGELKQSFRSGALFVTLFCVVVWAICATVVVAFHGTTKDFLLLTTLLIALNGVAGDMAWYSSLKAKANRSASAEPAGRDDETSSPSASNS